MSANIVEISQMIQNQDNLQKDMDEAMSLVTGLFKEKYLKKMHGAVAAQHTNAQKNPSKEIQLLKAMKQFSPEENHKNMDQMIDMLTMMSSVKNMQNELVKSHGHNTPTINHYPQKQYGQINNVMGNSVHDDGVYDIDDLCLSNKNNSQAQLSNFMMLMVLSSMK